MGLPVMFLLTSFSFIEFFFFFYCVDAGKRPYTHHFLLQLRFSPAAYVRPVDLELIPGVTDNTPGKVKDTQHL